MSRLNLSETQKRLLKIIAAGIVAVVALIQTLGQPPEEHEEIVRSVCQQAGLEELAEFAGLTEEGELCSHGPDPVHAFKTSARTMAASVGINAYYRQANLCPGNGRSGQRVYIHVGAPSDAPPVPSSFITTVKKQLGFAERQMRESHPTHAQKINYYCATDKAPTIESETYPAIGSDGVFDFDDMLASIDADTETRAGTHVSFVYGIRAAYPYCGEGTVGGFGDSEIHFALIAPDCTEPPNDTLLHELGHNFGAVAPAAPNDSGAWHCYDRSDVMCYNDGGSHFTSGGTMVARCAPIRWKASDGFVWDLNRFDCNHDDYYNPIGSLGWRNTADSLLLTRPRRK